MSRNLLLGLAVAAAVLCGGWYFASPLYAMSQLRDAAQAGDAPELESRVDFPALREDLKQEASAAMAEQISSNPDNPLAGAGSTLGMALVGPMIDAFVTPSMIARLLREGDTDGSRAAQARADGEAQREVEWQVDRSGISSFTAHPVNDDGEAEPELEFARDGFGWRLVGLNLPEPPLPSGN